MAEYKHIFSAQGVSCSHVEDHFDMNAIGILGAEDNAEIDGINQTEGPTSTISKQENGIKFANLGEWDLEPKNLD